MIHDRDKESERYTPSPNSKPQGPSPTPDRIDFDCTDDASHSRHNQLCRKKNKKKSKITQRRLENRLCRRRDLTPVEIRQLLRRAHSLLWRGILFFHSSCRSFT